MNVGLKICKACEAVAGVGSCDVAKKISGFWRIYPTSVEARRDWKDRRSLYLVKTPSLFAGSLEFTLSRTIGSLPGTSPSCGVLLCKTSSPGYSDDNPRNITSMSLYKVVSQARQTNSDGNKPNELRRLATVSSSKPDLERVSDGMRINGSVQNGQAV
ncbi:hypothetical protein ElyMa_004777000 [Elysia marginata]|uniref:Uncharacterized protein n=1 Tax=Elysia marginata TaxID=1093978 RepID=A0AAV4IHX7_9GAST|nr:hypothetical protein ElyMa_004777000 [Elysia marginata]